MTETLNTKGIVKSIKKDGKGLQLTDGNWYSGFAQLECSKGDEVEITYVVNGQWKNIKTITTTKKATVSQSEAREDKAKTMLVSYAKDLVVAMIQYAAHNEKEFDLKESLKLASEGIVESYESIAQQIEGKKNQEDKNETVL